MKIADKLYKAVREHSPTSIAIDVTSCCNFKCLHCFNESGQAKNDDLSDEEFFDAVRQIRDLHPISVCLCGGEPFMRFNRVVEALKILNGNVGQVNMVSNGWFATHEKLCQLKELGLKTYQVSLDGKNAFQHDNFRGVPGAFEHVVNAIKLAHAVGLQTVVAITPNKFNHKSISDILEMCYNWGVGFVRSMPLIPMGRGAKNQKFILSTDEYITYQTELRKAKERYQNRMMVEWGDPMDHLIRMPVNAKEGVHTYEIDIKSNGDIVPSIYFPITVGNIRNVTLQECWDNGFNLIWENPELLSLIGDIQDLHDFGKFFDNMGDKSKYILEMKK